MAKKRRKIISAEKEHVDYMSIGHTFHGDKVWIYDKGQIQWWPASEGMHSEVVKNHEKYWRGRYEVHTNKTTVIPPNGWKHAIPSWIVDKLEAEFDGDIKTYGFNPKRR